MGIYAVYSLPSCDLLYITSSIPEDVADRAYIELNDTPDYTKVQWDSKIAQFKSIQSRTLDKINFRRKFNESEYLLIDEFNATFEQNIQLSYEIKRHIRSGLANYNSAHTVDLDDIDTAKMLGLYVNLGFITYERMMEILS